MRLVWFYNKLTMNDTSTRLCAHDRKVIANMAQAGNNQTAIAKAIGRSQGTVSKELSRNRGQRGYRPLQADRLARERQAGKRSRPKVVVGVVMVRSPDGPPHPWRAPNCLGNGKSSLFRAP